MTKNEKWKRGLDLNQRPSGYEPDELPTAPPRCESVMQRPFVKACQKYLGAIHGVLHGLW